MFCNLVCNWTVQLCCTYAGVPLRQYRAYDGMSSAWKYKINISASPSQSMTHPSRIPILSPVLFMHVGEPYIPLF